MTYKASEELTSALKAKGFSIQKINQSIVPAITEIYAENSGILLAEMRKQIEDLSKVAYEANNNFLRLNAVSEKADKLIADMQDAFDVQGQLIQDKAKDTLLMFVTMLKVCKQYGVDMDDAVSNMGYILYAMLGGQARRESTVFTEQQFENVKMR